MQKIEIELEKIATIITNNIDKITNNKNYSLLAAIRYSALASGKMVRAFLVYNFCNILNITSKTSFLNIATAIELMHCYSLIHDDLPAMDNDDYRRGQKSSHKKYDEATAILSGDALQSLAFEVISQANTADNPAMIVSLINNFAKTVGYSGMAEGQFLDIQKKEKNQLIEKLIHSQTLKTGKLIEFSCFAPAIISMPTFQKKGAILNYAHDIGFAYQIKDDLLDIKSTKKELGKATQKDKQKGRKTLIDFIGVEKAEKQLSLLTNQAKEHLRVFGEEASMLLNFTDYLLARKK